MQNNAISLPREGGKWEQHLGDAPYYGTAFYVRATQPTGRTQESSQQAGAPDYRAIAAAARDYNLATLGRAHGDASWFLDNLEEVMMSTLGLIEYCAATGDRAPLPQVEDTIDTVDSLTIGLHNYVDVDAGMFAIREYGPTAITAAVALLNVQYGSQLGDAADPDRAAARLDLARKMVQTVDERAWDGTRYLIRPGDTSLDLYPSTMMMLLLGRLYVRTGETAFLDRAKAAYAAIQPLRSPRGGYNSPYSKDEMGAKTDDYSTLSSQNYLTLALSVMYEATADRRYVEEAVFVLDFIRSHLYDLDTGHLLHHFMDGRIALPTDPEYFCAGCNLQFLYVNWYLQHALPVDSAS
jgi:hypothetical protein